MNYQSENDIRFRFTVWRGGAPLTELSQYGGGTLVHDNGAEMQDSIQTTFYAYTGVNFVSDTLRVECDINGESYPLGRFCVTTEKPYETADGLQLVEIEGYSLLWYLKQSKLETVTTYAAGTNYATVIRGLISGAGFASYDIENTTAVLATDRADWDIGTDYLTIINDLLAEINYNPIYVDFEGVPRATKYIAPSISGVTHTYTAGRDSVISAEYRREADRFEKSNVFIVICDNPELPAALRAEAVNDDPASPYSTISVGRRVPYVERVDNTPSLAELQSYAASLKSKSMQTTEQIEITTAIMPDHGANETLLVQVGDIAGVYRETRFEINMSDGGQMKHEAVRVIV